MTGTDIAKSDLVYNGEIIHAKAEKLSLTDMWRAAGSPSGRAPSDWLALTSTAQFREAVEATLEAGISGIQTKRGGRGIGGSTFGHWQIGLAYAKYLDPQFHMLCNKWCRERMEGRANSAALDPEVLEMIERSFGISRMLSHKVTEIEKALPVMMTEVIASLTAEMIQPMIEARLEADSRAVAVGFKPALAVLVERKVPSRKRRAFSQKVSSRLRRFSTRNGLAMRFSRETGRYLFHVDAINGWLAEEGDRLIREHVAAIAGQGVLSLASSRGKAN